MSAATATPAASVRGRRPALTAAGLAVTRKPGRLIGLIIIVFFVLMGICGPWFYGSLAVDPNALYAPPSAKHWLGTDFAGSDVLQEVVTGARYVLATAALSAFFTSLFGVTIGLVAGYQRGLTDSALMRLTDFVLTIPGLPLLIILSTVWNFGSPWKMGLVLGLTGWGGVARAVRSQALSLRERGFLEAARGLGLSRRHIIVKELLPNIAPYATMQLMLSMIAFIGAEVGLFFLGLVPFSSTNWGVMLNQAVFSGGAMETSSALVYLLAPLVCILLLTLGIVLFLDAVDELFNPRLRERV